MRRRARGLASAIVSAGDKRVLAVDALLAGIGLALVASILSGPVQAAPVAWALAAAHVAPLCLRRLRPTLAFVTSTGAAVGYLAAGQPMVGLGPLPLAVVYSFASEATRRRAIGGVLAVEAIVVVHHLTLSENDAATLVGNAFAIAVAWFVGDSVRRRRDAAEVAGAAAAERAALDERLRLAREIHDIVAHSMTAVAVQAGAARMAIDHEAVEVRDRLETIERTARDSLSEMRHLLGVLRADDDATLVPIPGLDQIDALLAEAAGAGTPVDFEVVGDRRPLPPGIEATIYRALQEALTNVRRHAPGVAVHAVLTFDDDALLLEVENDPPPRPAAHPGAGRGLVGMRERVESSGGTVETGATPGGGFRVHVVLPERATP